VFTQSLSEASGLIPAGHALLDSNGKPQTGTDGKPVIQPTTTTAYFEITGDDKGNRNNLRADNPWNVLVSRITDDNARELAPIPAASLDDRLNGTNAPSGMAAESDPKKLAP
jgi:hypothetical protein